MPYRTDVVYRYDGTLDGFLCCVYESYANKEMPAAILGPGDEQLSLLATRDVETDVFRAARVLKSIPARISEDALYLVERVMLTCMPEREKRLLEFLHLGYRKGSMVMDMLHDDAVAPLLAAVTHLGREAHLYLGFVRFTENAGVLAAVIEPKNRVLPLIAQHFVDRYPNESFVIFDRTHREALVSQRGRGRVAPLEALELPDPDDLERAVRALWRRFHQTVGIDQRKNYACQRTHLPLRYRRVMTEFEFDPASRSGAREAIPSDPDARAARLPGDVGKAKPAPIGEHPALVRH
jgi:probable DNA metabolism protein